MVLNSKLDNLGVRYEIDILGSIYPLDERIRNFNNGVGVYQCIYKEPSYIMNRKIDEYDFLYIIGVDTFPVGSNLINDSNALSYIFDISDCKLIPTIALKNNIRNYLETKISDMETNTLHSFQLNIHLFKDYFEVWGVHGVTYDSMDNSDGILIFGLNFKC